MPARLAALPVAHAFCLSQRVLSWTQTGVFIFAEEALNG
jgi:hypothetical protein